MMMMENNEMSMSCLNNSTTYTFLISYNLQHFQWLNLRVVVLVFLLLLYQYLRDSEY